MYPSPFRVQVGLAWLLVFACGLITGSWGYHHARERRLADLKVDARRCALAFDPRVIAGLDGSRRDLADPAYAEVKERLLQLHAVHPDVRFVSIFRVLPAGGGVIYLADSEPTASREVSLPGDPFPEAPQMPGLQAIIEDGQPATEGPIRDSFGVFVTGYALIGAPRSTPEGTVREMVVLDVAAKHWNAELFDAAAKVALYTWLLMATPLGVLTFWMRHSRRDALIGTLSQAMQQSQSGILVVAPTGRIEFANEGLCRQLGLRADELVGHSCAEFRPAALRDDVAQEMLAAIRAGKSWEGEWQNRRLNGQTYPAQVVVTPVQSRRGAPLGFIAVISDLTAHQRHQEELRRAKDRAEAGDRAKGEFLATMSHEVRTPLNGIVGFTNLLLETSLTLEQREYVQTIRTSGEALVQLTGDILDFSRIESGGLQLDASVCDLRATVEDALDLFAARAAEKGIELLHCIDPDVPQSVLLDAGRLRQILVNLVGNGIKFTTTGYVEVTVRALTGKGTSLAPFDPSALAGQMVAELADGSLTFEFSVRDTGIGISAEDRPKLFQPFTQLDVSTVRRYGGAGLGLAISRNLVRLMGGSIWLESAPGEGSTFYFTVRGRPPPASELQVLPACELTRCRVGLIIETPALRAEIGRVLESSGALVVETTLAQAAEARCDLTVLECHDALIADIDTQAAAPGWRADRIIGLVTMTASSLDRQFLRPHVRMLLNRPVHHRTLLDILSRAWAKVAEEDRV